MWKSSELVEWSVRPARGGEEATRDGTMWPPCSQPIVLFYHHLWGPGDTPEGRKQKRDLQMIWSLSPGESCLDSTNEPALSCPDDGFMAARHLKTSSVKNKPVMSGREGRGR